jgi:fermentation-respiration switch protein FrsA (DUF1100 family)
MCAQSLTKERFAFQSGGERLVGNLFVPRDADASGLVITTGPFTSVKEQAAGAYAQAMAERGLAALAFDHRCFGESGGQPRQFENPRARIEDIRAAATALLEDERLAGLPVYGLGVCYGAGPMAIAVDEDERCVAFAGIAGVYTDAAQTKEWMGNGYRAALERAQKAERVWKETGVAEMIPAVAPDGGDVAMPLREAYEFYGTPRGAAENYTNGFAVQSRSYTLPFDVTYLASQMRKPVLIVHSEQALLPSLAHRFFDGLVSKKEELWLQSVGQIDFYDDRKLIGRAADKAADWFRRHR